MQKVLGSTSSEAKMNLIFVFFLSFFLVLKGVFIPF